ncbi:hypothetical protein [Caulobacter vibrioides]|uniref:Uncharacterized protein n=2 Tax=Caulobacter vibrioides TaxID=155892 RepID=Q9A3Z8_CAUVC|nr:hypothetical protein [Caulobacter vibrioides]YP_002518520.1 hypothetical protein CCNA_03147 [Caulobacter vibrioides NA1000]AAK25014.1 hypothetical protein CC_3052 [Caulobacter vibrioides CB15]ACL96612.1 hypothetical protein CCNA_03147 [Caulobacter vibrioides NA1000]ATC29884.1 hypothetical protein CA607_16425 [Caulobacter vibrioides]QXZ51399.1 hypothetical protein KZH45_16175 [Caulobacter vibrioides]
MIPLKAYPERARTPPRRALFTFRTSRAIDCGYKACPGLAGDAMTDIPDLQRVTTEYVAVEDRVRISGEAADGATVVLWLTQRLLNLLVPRLTGGLEQPDSTSDALMQGFAQQAAEASLSPQPAVEAAAPSASWRVDSVDILSGPDGVALTFRSDEGPAARLSLANEPLRQWLSILRRQYQAAGWIDRVWPVWMEDDMRPAARPDATPLH